MENLNEKKMHVLRNATTQLNNYVATLCSIRPDIYSINNAEWAKQIEEIKDQIGANQLLLFIGPFSSGKSSFINALLGEDILPTSNRPCTSVVTELSFVDDGLGHRGLAVRKDNESTETEYDYNALLKMVDGPTGAIGESAAYHHIELQFDIKQLKHESACLKQLCDAEVTIVDCPGYGSPYYSNEDVIEEYISKASHTFWINPVDRIGGISDYKKLAEIRKKTTTLIPIMSKADLIDSLSKKEEICDSYSENIGSLFRSKDPIFCSAIKYSKGREIEKEIAKGKLTGEELHAKEAEMNLLFEESGLSNVFAAVIDSASEKSVTYAKVKSVLHDLDSVMVGVSATAEKERKYWQKELKANGWDDCKNAALETARSEASIWIDSEAERVGRQLDNEIKECVLDYVKECGGRINQNELLGQVRRIWEKQFDTCSSSWSNKFANLYGEKIRASEIDGHKDFKLPDWLNPNELMLSIHDTCDVIFQTINDSGVKTVAQGGIGGALLVSLASIKAIPIAGAALCPIAGVVGVALLAVAAFGFIPVYSRYSKNKNDERQRDLEAKIRKWLDDLGMREVAFNILAKQNEDIFNRLEKESQKVGEDLIDKKSQCESVISGISALKAALQVQFATSK